MIALVLALLLSAQEPPPASAEADSPMATAEPATVASTPPDTPPAPAAPPLPVGAPSDDYGLVGWCLGALEGYIAQHDRVMPDVERIEAAYRRPGSSLAEDLKVYADQQVQGRAHLQSFTAALQAAERASLSALRPRGEAAIARGRAVWAPAANLPTRTVAQQWMGWTLPQVCVTTAERLTRNAALLGAAFDPEASLPETPPDVPPEAPAANPPDVVATPAFEGAADPIPEAPFEPPPGEGPPALREAPGAG